MSPGIARAQLLAELTSRRERVYGYLQTGIDPNALRSLHLGEAVASYLQQPGKGLRSSILLLCCGATGGAEERAVPAAAAVELFHIWTLVHDDIIDQDDLRRGRPTVHADFAERAKQELHLTGADAAHYGRTQALLAGDLQQGWSAMLLTKSTTERGVDATLVLNLIAELFGSVEARLVDGEALDVQFSLQDITEITEAEVLDMMQKKTGVLYAFAATAGACIGLNAWRPEDSTVSALTAFATNCGIAFQLQDDVLGVVGDSAATGKPVGADIREGKRTLIVKEALRNASAAQHKQILNTLGNRTASNEQVQVVTRLLLDLGGVAHAHALAQAYIDRAHSNLAPIPQQPHRQLLHAIADFVLERDS
ncbi:MAG: polyprenyl synthetase family protein [Chloroflexi bacterium]|nr:polyprenyl synthetase family protein [Chloroflexota bacterium]